MCYTMNWRTDTKMDAVHQNIIAFGKWPEQVPVPMVEILLMEYVFL